MSTGTNRIIWPLIVSFVLLTTAPIFAGKIIYVDDGHGIESYYPQINANNKLRNAVAVTSGSNEIRNSSGTDYRRRSVVSKKAQPLYKPALKDFINDRVLLMSEGVWHSSCALADLDGDGKLEIVVGSIAGYIYAWHHDGRLVDGWPQKAHQGTNSSPAVGDMDGDGDMEVAWGGNVWHHNGVKIGGWPHMTNNFCSPALADIDGDGGLEVIFGNLENGLDVRHHDGTLAEGWPQKTKGYIRTTPAVGDIDGDGFVEIITYSWDQHLYAWNHDGSLLPGWPVATTGRVQSPPSLADIDGNGKLDHIVCEGGIYRPSGERIGKGLYRAVPVDLNKDGHIDIVGMRGAKSFEGKYLPGWPVSVYSGYSDGLGVADIDGDEDLELLWSSRSNFLYAFNNDGTPTHGWPRWLVEVGDTAPAIADLDADGDIEVVLSTGIDRTFIWDEPALYRPDAIAWPMLGGGPKCTGVFERNKAASGKSRPKLSHIGKCLAAGDFESAIAEYRSIVSNPVRSPDEQAEALISIARIYNWRLQDDEKAFQEYQDFIDVLPQSRLLPDAFLEISDIYRYRLFGQELRDRFAGVTEKFRKIIEAYPDQIWKAKELFLLGNAYELLDDERQKDIFEKVVNDYPDSYWAQISSLYLRYEGVPHHLAISFGENSILKTGQQDIKEGDLLRAELTKSFTISSFSPAKQTFPCRVGITTQHEFDEVRGPKYPFPRDPGLLVSWDDRSNVVGEVRQQELPDGNSVFSWKGVVRSNHLHTGLRGGGGFTFLSRSGSLASDIAVERKFEKLSLDRQLCKILVTSTWEPILKISQVAGIIDTTSPKPSPSWAIGDMIYFGRRYRTKPEGTPETIEFSFVVKLRPEVDHFYPGIRVSSHRQTKRISLPGMGKTGLKFKCSFGGQTYEITSSRRFKVKEMESIAARDYNLDSIIERTK